MGNTAGGARRLRSRTVVLGGVGMLAAALTSCGGEGSAQQQPREPDKRCVDPKSYNARVKGYRIVDTDRCDIRWDGPGGRWYYDAKKRGKYAVGGHFDDEESSGETSGGSYDSDPTSGGYTSGGYTSGGSGSGDGGSYGDSDIDRGGFGGSSSGSGGG
ncbi:hypothetical protein IHE55_17730 [Streptomyces pactum]|uniref:Lipoprotein n=1 Tax=Streptomyces pactum TaxID=68249 RepID=A0ABS0NMW0_9ACTN|nr:hypothetical protein [Streptomyces pactum]MBH5336513.1 hypothetical protein [Streptomyces pactum]